LLTLMPRDKVPTVPLYLYYVLFPVSGQLLLSAHGHSIAGPGVSGNALAAVLAARGRCGR